MRYIPVAIRTRVVPVSTIPDVMGRIELRAAPYVIDSSIPTNSLEGEVEVMGLRIK